MPEPDEGSTVAVDRDVTMEEFNDSLSYSAGSPTPTTHAVVVRDDNDLLIHAKRSCNAEGEWEVRRYSVGTPGLELHPTDRDRADLAAVLLQEFDADALAAGSRPARGLPRDTVPPAIAVDGKPAVAAWLYVRGWSREEIAEEAGVGSRTVGEYLSRVRRRGVGIPEGVDAPEVGAIVPEVPEELSAQHIVARGSADE